VVGVAKMANYNTLLEVPRLFYYVPLEQFPAGTVVLHVRATLPPGAMAAALAREVHALDRGVAPSQLFTMREYVAIKSDAQTVALTLVGIFGGLALLLATIGLYGVMSYAVSQGQRELGLRMALGAAASDLLALVMRHGAALTAGGVLLGAAAALGSTRLLGSLLYHVSPRDPLVFGSAFLAMAAASLAACLLPAWRAARTDPARALRD
jgi:ABC-type antimicrobial peptide transport system permease subunit